MRTIRTWLLMVVLALGTSGMMCAQALDEMHSNIMKDFGKVASDSEAAEKSEVKKDKKSDIKEEASPDKEKKSDQETKKDSGSAPKESDDSKKSAEKQS